MPFTDEQLKRAEAAAERPTLDGSQAGRDAAQAWVATWDWKGGRRADHWAAVDWKSFWAQAKKDWAKITAAARARRLRARGLAEGFAVVAGDKGKAHASVAAEQQREGGGQAASAAVA